MRNYRLFTKMESVVSEFQNQLTIFDSNVLSGVRGLSKGIHNNRRIVPYANCEYLGELAERCEERNLANNARSLRSILMAFVMETKTTSGEDFLYNQFEIFEKIYKRVIGKDYSILDEILLKKCKSQISGNRTDFDLNCELFSEARFTESTIEEQTLSILALSAYRSSISDKEIRDKYDGIFVRAIKVFCENKESDLELLSYVSLSHIYDTITALSREDKSKSFSKKQKDFYKLIKEITTTDLSKIFEANDNSYNNEDVFICNQWIKLDKLMDISYRSIAYESTEMMIKKPMTFPAKCRKIGKSFNYALTKGEIQIFRIEEIRKLYTVKNKEFHPKCLADYIDFKVVQDTDLYCELYEQLLMIDIWININDFCFHYRYNTTIASKITEEIFDLYDDGNLEKINKLCKEYEVYEYLIKFHSEENLQALKIALQVSTLNGSEDFSILEYRLKLLLRNNCIDSDLNIIIDDLSIKAPLSIAKKVARCAWENNMLPFAIDVCRKHQEAFKEILGGFRLETDSYYVKFGITTEDIIKDTIERAKETEHYSIVFDFICELLIRSCNFDILQSFIKSNFDEVVRVYEYTDEDKELLIKELISEHVDVVNKTISPDDFLISTVGIDNAFRILEINNDDVFDIKMNYLKKMSSEYYLTPFKKNCIEIISNSLYKEDLEKIEIDKYKKEIQSMKVDEHYIKYAIRYVEKNQIFLFKHYIEDLKDYLELALSSSSLTTLSTLHMYFNSKEVKELDDVLEKIQAKAIEMCANL